MTTHEGETQASELILYRSEDARTRVEVRLEGGTVWLTQAQMAELFQTTPQNITTHLRSIYTEGELSPDATCKDYLQVRPEGGRSVERRLKTPWQKQAEAMNTERITESSNPVLAGSLPALRRAAKRAMRIAEQTGTRLIVAQKASSPAKQKTRSTRG